MKATAISSASTTTRLWLKQLTPIQSIGVEKKKQHPPNWAVNSSTQLPYPTRKQTLKRLYYMSKTPQINTTEKQMQASTFLVTKHFLMFLECSVSERKHGFMQKLIQVNRQNLRQVSPRHSAHFCLKRLQTHTATFVSVSLLPEPGLPLQSFFPGQHRGALADP